MKYFVCMLILFFVFEGKLAFGVINKDELKAARGVIERYLEDGKLKLKLSNLKADRKYKSYESEIKNGVVKIKGNSGVAICRGFYDLVKEHDAGIVSWTGRRLDLDKLPSDRGLKRVVAPFQHHYYFNVVTYGYTLPYWDWNRWEQEIDWMALHGMDMPLALVANEAISKRVWKRIGLTDGEISDYFTAPAHFPWMRMGNASSIDAGIGDDWHNKQIELQHRILKRMRDLGMKPICPGFAGMVPKGIKRIQPNIKLYETNWVGFKNWMIDPEEELFHEIGKMFIEEWEKEFGKCDYYLADSFNEMELPFYPHNDARRYEQLSKYGERVYASIKAGNPDAVWVMQGWMFGYQRYIWDQKSLAALVQKVPNEKMLLLDLAVDYNKHFWKSTTNWDFHKGFYGKPWVYSTIPNMGGKTGFTGVLDFYAQGHWEAVNSPLKGNLVGYGTAPEGIENNEVIYELITDAGWSDEKIETESWLENYSRNRYGFYNDSIAAMWKHFQSSVYGTFTDHPKYNWQSRPGITRKGSIHVDDNLFAATEAMLAIADNHKEEPLFMIDLAENVALYVGAKLDIQLQKVFNLYDYGMYDEAKVLENQFVELLNGVDQILSQHPTHRMDKWINYARAYGENTKMKDYYERNARRIITIWGPPVDDYSARIWSGLIRDYYVPRWQHYFATINAKSDFSLPDWERNWVEKQTGLSDPVKYDDLLTLAKHLVHTSKGIRLEELDANVQVIGNWQTGQVGDQWKQYEYTLSVQQAQKLAALRFDYTTGSDKLEVKNVSIWVDGKKIAENTQQGETGIVDQQNVFRMDMPKEIMGNNQCVMRVEYRCPSGPDSNGRVEIILKQN